MVGQKIAQLEARKRVAVEQEDYDLAKVSQCWRAVGELTGLLSCPVDSKVRAGGLCTAAAAAVTCAAGAADVYDVLQAWLQWPNDNCFVLHGPTRAPRRSRLTLRSLESLARALPWVTVPQQQQPLPSTAMG
jgi:hypothetical protein